MVKVLTIALLILTMTATVSSAQEKEVPFLLSILTPLAIPIDVESVNGFRLNLIYGRNKRVDGVDFGLIQVITEKGNGPQLGGWNFASSIEGPQFGILGNMAEKIDGPQIAVGANRAGNIVGSQLSILINYAKEMGASQFSLINRALKLNGVQFGLVNIADESNGKQIGLLNFANGKMIPFYNGK